MVFIVLALADPVYMILISTESQPRVGVNLFG